MPEFVSAPDDLGLRLAEMVVSMHEEATATDTVERVLDFACAAVDGSHAAVVFVHGKRRIETVAGTDPAVATLDAKQMELRQGPDISIAREQTGVIVDDTQHEDRWPAWAAAAADAGFRSMMGARLYTSERSMGSINVYDSRPSHFSTADLQVLHVVARHAAIALSRAQESDHLWRAIDSRKLIGQAQGILMERYDLDDERAFEVLRRHSQNANLKLRDVAQLVVDTRQLPTEG
jgi:GAF domain-containing protein